MLGPATRAYNCIAYSLGRDDEWINAETGAADDPLSKLDRRYEENGYRRLAVLDPSLQVGTHKIVVYAMRNADGMRVEIKHAARQEKDGTWSSNLGQGPLIRHETAEALSGPAYGEPVAVYARQLQAV